MASDSGQDEIERRRARIAAALDRLAYREGADSEGPPARRVDTAVLGSVGQAVWVTADPLHFVDGYYRPLLQLDVGTKDVGVMTGEGRWSFFHDARHYPAAGLVRPKGTRQSARMMAGPFEEMFVIVLIVRQPEAPLTEISVSVFPDDEDPRRT